jgi:hypothetical protein
MTTPVVSASKNHYMQRFLEASADSFTALLVQVAVSILKPPHGGFRSETAVAQLFRK